MRSLAWASRYIRCNPCQWPSKLLEGRLYLGNYEAACNPLAIKALNIRRIINCTPDRINLWEKRPKIITKGSGSGEEHVAGSTMSPPLAVNGASTECEDEREEAERRKGQEPSREKPLACILFPEVRIEAYLRIPVMDNYTDSISDSFEKAFDFIETARLNSQAVLVHCAQGVSRSVAIVLAYLMQAERMSLEEAYDFVRRKRSVSKPNAGFLKQLSAFEMQLHGTTSMQTCRISPPYLITQSMKILLK